MARGKRGKRGGGGGGGGVRRPPPSSSPEESSHNNMNGGGGGSSIRSGISSGGRSSTNSRRAAEDPPTTRSAVEPGPSSTSRNNNNERARSRDPPLSDNNEQGYVRNNNRRPSTTSSTHSHQYPQRSSNNNTQQRTSYNNDEYSIQSSSQQSRRSARRNNSIILNTKEEELYEEYQDQLYNQQFNTNDTQSISSGQSFGQSFTPSFQSIQSNNINQQQFQQPSFQVAHQVLQQQQIMHPEFEIIPSHQPEILPSQQQQQQQQLQSAAQFNLTPLYNDVEMASLHSSKSNGSKKKKMKKGSRQSRRREEENKTIQFEDEVSVLSYNSNPNSGRYTERSSNNYSGRLGSGSKKKNKRNQGGGSYYPVDTRVLDFLEQSDSSHDEDDSEDDYDYPEDEAFVNEDKQRRKGGSRSSSTSRNHEEFYNYDTNETDDDDESSYDDDEERPFSSSSSRLRKNKNRYKVLPKQSPSIISRSEQCLNRTLVFIFVTMCFIFIRNHTPWWKEHVRRVNSSKHHHHNILAGTDDDDQANTVDPMAVYNTNDDDSTHTRDHDPTHKYDEITNHVDGAVHNTIDDETAANYNIDEKREEVVEVNPDSKYFQSKPGERVSNRPAEKSLHHGFNDEQYSDRPQAEVSASEYTEAISRGEVPPPPQRDFIYEKPPDAEGGDITSMHTSPGDVSRYENVVGSESIEVAPSMQQQQQQQQQKEEEEEKEVSSLAVVPPPPLPMQQQQVYPVQEEQQEFAAPEVPPPSLAEQQQQQFATPEAQHEMSVSNPPDDDSLGGDLVEWGTSNDVFNDVFNGDAPGGNINDDSRVDEQVKEMGWDGSNGSSAGGGEPSNSQMITNPIEQQTVPTQEENVSSPPPPEESKQPLMPIMSQAPMSGDEIKAVYEDSFNRWNHPFDESKDVPLFWRIPRSASGTVESVLSYCYRMVLANSMGTANGHDQDTNLDVVQLGTGAMYVNVDMATPTGIQHAKDMNLGSSDMANAVVTPFIFETAANIFKDTTKSGKCFTLLRHPVDRAVSLYHHYQMDESGNPNTSQYKGMSIEEYADNVAENNWLVRFLTNKRGGNLTWKDLEAAKDVFGKKCLIGLVDKIDESLSRYEHFFGWDKKISDSDRKDKCVRQYLDSGDKRQEHPTYEGTTAWETLRKKNEYDEILYEYAKNLFEQQTSIYEKTT